MTKYFLFACVLASMFISQAHAEETAFARVMKSKTIRCGYLLAPPYLDKDPNTGKMSGINVDIMAAIGRNLGVTIAWTAEVGAGEVAAALSANKFDVMCQTIWPSAARYTGMTFATRPEFYSAIYAVARADDTRFDGDLAKANRQDVKAVGIEGDFSIDLVNEKLPATQHAPLANSTTLADYFMQLTTKKADILFMDKATLNNFSKTNPHQLKLVTNVPPARIFGEHLTVKLGEYQLRDALDMALLQLNNDGIIEELVQQTKEKYQTDIYAAAKDVVK